MTITDEAVLVTGANRGNGPALIVQALRSDAKRVYVAARRPSAHPDPRVTPQQFTTPMSSMTHRKPVTTLTQLANPAAFVASAQAAAMTGTVANLTAGIIVD